MPENGYSLTDIDHILTRALGIHDAVEIDRPRATNCMAATCC